jgi:homoserine dehydrogenase
MSKNSKKITLFGYGCVGQGFYQQAKKGGYDFHPIGVRTAGKKRNLPDEAFTINEWVDLDNEEISALVELISETKDAYNLTLAGLNENIPVVSANKKMIAENFPELLEAHLETGTPWLYEGSVAGSIPIIHALDAYFANEEVRSVEGIFSGSSNYILSQIFDQQWSYEKALAKAQELGFAEENPTLDVGGFDAANKISISAIHAFGTYVHPEEIYTSGVDQLQDPHIAFAKEHGLKIKQVAQAKLVNGKLSLSVAPHLVEEGNPLFNVNNEFNGVRIQSEFSDEQFLQGRGAGAHPTGSAVYSDFKRALAGKSYDFTKYKNGNTPEFSNELSQEIIMVNSFYETEIKRYTLAELKEKQVAWSEKGYVPLFASEELIKKLKTKAVTRKSFAIA